MRGSLPFESLADGLTASVVSPQLLSTSLCPWDRPVPTEADEGGFKWAQSFWVQPQLLKGREVDDVRRTSVVHEDSFGIESFYVQHYNQRIVVGLFHSSGISFIKGHVSVRLSMFER